jgi:crotonobetainyl-CoA:carnitine CoA-transferase CaiB-like acyl-CoA transferase
MQKEVTVRPSPSGTGTALPGLRVLDLSRILAAPYAAQMLGDFGADVIKVERPGDGDESRTYGPAKLKTTDGKKTEEGAMYLSANRNKRSIAVDISKPAGQDIVRRLASRADVLFENYKTGTLAQYGLDYPTLRKLNPRLVYCSVTGYGQTGPYARRPGYDVIFQAQSGMLSCNGIPDGEPGAGSVRTGFAVSDMIAGYHALAAVQAALLERELVSGEGQYIDISLLDCAIASMSHAAQNYLISGQLPMRQGLGSQTAAPAGMFECADGAIYVLAPSNTQFAAVCKLIGRPELINEPRFASTGLRGEARVELNAILNDAFRTKTRKQVTEELVAAGIPCTDLNNLGEALNDPQVQHRGMTVEMRHAINDHLTLLANPIRFSRTPVRYDHAPPLVGQHTDAILREELGMDAQAIAQLRTDGVI